MEFWIGVFIGMHIGKFAAEQIGHILEDQGVISEETQELLEDIQETVEDVVETAVKL